MSTIILESYILSPGPVKHGQFISCGMVQTTDTELLSFFRNAHGNPVLGGIVQEGNTVTIERINPVSGIVTESNRCNCITYGDANTFYDNVMSIAHRQDFARSSEGN